MAAQPLEFYPIANPNSSAKFVANGLGYSLTLGEASMLVTTYRKRASDPAADKRGLAAAGGASAPGLTPQQILTERATVEFVGADRSAKAEGLEPSTAYANFMIGNDPANWRSHVTGYGRVRYTNVYPGIDLIFHGEIHRKLEYDLAVAPGADSRQIRLRVAGDRDAQIGKDGELELNGPEGGIRLDPPMLYQNFRGGKKAVAGGFVKLAHNLFGIRTAGYDTTKPLIIDPTISLVYSTYIGGRHPDDANDIVVDGSGNSYIVGSSASQDFPVSANAYQTFNFNLADLDYRRVFLCSEDYSINYVLGLRYANMKEQFHSEFDHSITVDVDTNVNFDGGGLRLGLEGERFGCNHRFFVYGKGAVSLLGGEFEGSYVQGAPTLTPDVQTDWREARLVTILDCELGAGWESPNGHVRLSAGYTINAWLNAVKTADFIASVQANQYHGTNQVDGSGLVFDGVVARVEFKR